MSRVNEVRHLIAEAIDAVAAPVVRERVIERALDLAGADEVPDQGRHIRVFIREHLAAALAEAMEREAAESVVHSLSPLMERTSGAEMTGLHHTIDLGPLPVSQLVEPTVRVPEAPKLRLAAPRASEGGTLSVLVLFSSDDEKPKRIAAALDDGAPTCRAPNSLAMLDALRDHGDEGAVVVVDCVDVAVEPWALIALGGQIGPGARLLFWGPAPDFELELSHLDGRRWRTASAAVTPEQIARICCALVRAPAPR